MERRLSAILVADMVGFSRLVEAAEEDTLRRQKSIRKELIDPRIAAAQGRIVKSTGDGVLVEFPSAVEAVRAAIDIQTEMEEREAPAAPDRQIRYRIGIHVGDLVADEGDVFGDGVNIASRLETIAEAGGISISATVYEQIAATLGSAFADHGERQLKNISRPIREYRWQSAPSPAPALPRTGRKPTLRLGAFQALGGSDAQDLAEGCVHQVTALLANYTGLDLIDGDTRTDHRASATFQVAGGTYRATVKLQDTETGESFLNTQLSGSVTDLFATQDALSARIAEVIRFAILQREAESATDDGAPEAWLTAAGQSLMGGNRQEWSDAEALSRKTLKAQPDNFMAWAMLGCALLWEAYYGFRPISAARAQAGLEATQKAIQIRDQSDFSHAIMGNYHWAVSQDLDAAIRSTERSLEITPNYIMALTTLGLLQTLQGDPRKGLKTAYGVAEFSQRIRFHHRVLQVIALGHLISEEFEPAIDMAERALLHGDEITRCHMIIASAHGHLGRLGDARRINDAIKSRHPDYRMSNILVMPFRDPGHWEILTSGLRLSGIEE